MANAYGICKNTKCNLEVYTASEMDTKLANKSDSTHNHDDRYYTESEINTKLNGKANSSHTHVKSQITDFAHNHDDRYYTETEIKTKLKNLFVTWEASFNNVQLNPGEGKYLSKDATWDGKTCLGVVGIDSVGHIVSPYITKENDGKDTLVVYAKNMTDMVVAASFDITVLYANNQ